MAQGFEKVIIQVLDENEYAVEGKRYEFNAGKGGAVEAKISGLEAPQNTTYASNAPFHVTAKGVSAPKLELTVVDMDDVKGSMPEILGLEVDEDGTIAWTKDTEPPYVAVLLESSDRHGDALYMAMLKGKLTFSGDELKTREDKGEEIQPTQLSGEFIARAKDGRVKLKNKASNEGFVLEEFMNKVFIPKPVTP